MKKRIGLFEFFAFGIMIGIFICFISYCWIGTMSLSIGIGIIISGGGVILIMVTQKFLRKEKISGS